jgi:lipopolysaccharide/colanic/teichoic acid biosynthesis glycosyltransferase
LGFSLVAGLFLFLVGPIIALLIRLDSPGPIFYRQSRLGRGGQTFDLIKFRSMSVNAEKGTGAKWATKNDPRITRIGQILRRTRLDELPQILNILKGDIHLIGPRPERPEFTEQLEKEVPFYRARLAVKPGLTGWAQVKYRYGSSVDDTITKLQYDLYYIKHRSIMLNLLIILKTIGVVLSCKGT